MRTVTNIFVDSGQGRNGLELEMVMVKTEGYYRQKETGFENFESGILFQFYEFNNQLDHEIVQAFYPDFWTWYVHVELWRQQRRH